jgi:hypothetical protein
MLSTFWATQLAELVSPGSGMYERLRKIENGYGVLNLKDLEDYESSISRNHAYLYAQRVAAAIELTRFPVPASEDHQ